MLALVAGSSFSSSMAFCNVSPDIQENPSSSSLRREVAIYLLIPASGVVENLIKHHGSGVGVVT